MNKLSKRSITRSRKPTASEAKQSFSDYRNALDGDARSAFDKRLPFDPRFRVETVDEALTAIGRPGVATVQIILNAFRLKPFDEVIPVAAEAGVGIIARVPLASGLL